MLKENHLFSEEVNLCTSSKPDKLVDILKIDSKSLGLTISRKDKLKKKIFCGT